MAISIVNRVCGVGMATLGTAIFVWWLAALAGGPESYANFHYWVVDAQDTGSAGWVVNCLTRVVGVGMTWAFFTHLGNGVRHFWMDLGAGFELKRNRTGALAVFAFGILATIAVWAYIFSKGTM